MWFPGHAWPGTRNRLTAQWFRRWPGPPGDRASHRWPGSPAQSGSSGRPRPGPRSAGGSSPRPRAVAMVRAMRDDGVVTVGSFRGGCRAGPPWHRVGGALAVGAARRAGGGRCDGLDGCRLWLRHPERPLVRVTGSHGPGSMPPGPDRRARGQGERFRRGQGGALGGARPPLHRGAGGLSRGQGPGRPWTQGRGRRLRGSRAPCRRACGAGRRGRRGAPCSDPCGPGPR